MKKICHKDLSVFDITYHERWWNIPAHIKSVWRMIKNVYYRAMYGFCPTDVWNLHYHLSGLMTNMLGYLKEEHMGHPCDMTEEEWIEYLDKLAKLFTYIDIDEDEITQPLFDKWEALHDKCLERGEYPFQSKDEEMLQSWNEYSKAAIELDKRREEALSEALEMLKTRYFDLWD